MLKKQGIKEKTETRLREIKERGTITTKPSP